MDKASNLGLDVAKSSCIELSKISDWCAEREIQFVEYLVPDFNGIAKGKTLEVAALDAGEIRIAEAIFGQDILGRWVEDRELIDIADIDMALVPDQETLVPQPPARCSRSTT